MFRQVFIAQCLSSGDFLGHPDLFTRLVDRAAIFNTYEEAADTAFDLLSDDFQVFSYYKKITLAPHYLGGVTLKEQTPQVIRGDRTL